MKVILLENLRRIGSIGEIIDVKRGFARNFLISNKKALYASKENIAEVEKIKSELGKKDTEKKDLKKDMKFDKDSEEKMKAGYKDGKKKMMTGENNAQAKKE